MLKDFLSEARTISSRLNYDSPKTELGKALRANLLQQVQTAIADALKAATREELLDLLKTSIAESRN